MRRHLSLARMSIVTASLCLRFRRISTQKPPSKNSTPQMHLHPWTPRTPPPPPKLCTKQPLTPRHPNPPPLKPLPRPTPMILKQLLQKRTGRPTPRQITNTTPPHKQTRTTRLRIHVGAIPITRQTLSTLRRQRAAAGLGREARGGGWGGAALH